MRNLPTKRKMHTDRIVSYFCKLLTNKNAKELKVNCKKSQYGNFKQKETKNTKKEI